MSDNTIRYIILNCITVFGVAALIFFVFRNLRLNLLFDTVACSIMAVVGIACFFIARSKISRIIPFWLEMIAFGLFCCLLVWNGDAEGAGFLAIYIFPPLTIILLGMNGGVIISSLLLFVIAIEFIVPGASRFTYHPEIFPRVIISYMLETMIITVFERSRQNKDKVNKKLNDELTHINENLQEIVEERTNSLLKLRDCFGRYLPDNIIKKVMESPGGPSLGGEKRMISALITDIRGFTLLAENTDSETIVTMLNHYFTVMVEIIHAHNGTVIEFIGDSILAIFGAPLELERHADYAVACAVKMQSEMSDVNKWNERNGCPAIEMGIGINSGDSIVGNIGSEKAMKYNVIGKHINLASRIESYTTGGQILVSDFTKKLLSSPFTVSHTMEINPKGFSGAIPVSQITAIGEPFNISCDEIFPDLIPLPKPVPLLCYKISEKDIHTEGMSAEIGELSEKEAVILLAAHDCGLLPFDNVKLQCSGAEVMAKVNSIEEGRVTLRFTSAPKSFLERVKAP